MARNAEAQLQASIVRYVNWVAPDVLIFHVPNGAFFDDDGTSEDKRARAKRRMAKLKWMGLVPGIPDLVLIIPRIVSGILGMPLGAQWCFWEVKPKGKALSDEQLKIEKWCIYHNVRHRVVRSIEDARYELKDSGAETREAGWHEQLALPLPKAPRRRRAA